MGVTTGYPARGTWAPVRRWLLPPAELAIPCPSPSGRCCFSLFLAPRYNPDTRPRVLERLPA